MSDVEQRSALEVVRGSRTLAYGLGAVTLLAGLILLFWPDRTITVIARLNGLLLVVVGIADLLDAIRNHRGQPYWLLLALRGAINLGFGLALLFWPGITISVLVWLVGLDLVLAGVLGLVVRGQLPKELRAGTLGRSVVTIVFGLVIMVWPNATLAVLALLLGGLLVVFGAVLLASGYQISKLAKQITA